MKSDNAFGFWGGVAIIALVFAMGFMVSTARAYEVQYPQTRGGYLHEFIAKAAQANSNGEEVRITSSKCYSACTVYLGADRMCTTRRTVFGFHCAKRGGKCAPEIYPLAIAAHLGKLSPSLSAEVTLPRSPRISK